MAWVDALSGFLGAGRQGLNLRALLDWTAGGGCPYMFQYPYVFIFLMQILRKVSDLRAALHLSNGTLGLVPTMGALHEGHLSLVRAARSRCDLVAASIFVNPLQFGANEDLGKYPQSFDRDCDLLRAEDVDFLFAPTIEEMYPAGAVTHVVVEGLSDKLCGKSRPGHFRGVTTVVAKLFNIVEPDVAFFGQKDAAQVAIIRRIVRDLNFAVEIVVCPIVRELDGLAMSSRNTYLSTEERKEALVLHESLMEVQKKLELGERNVVNLISAGRKGFTNYVRLDYLEIVDPETLDPMTSIAGPALVAVAAWVGNTRLIDNVVLENKN